MNITELVKLPIEEFKKELGQLNKEEYLYEVNQMNILHYAFFALNIDVINYLIENNIFDLKTELMKGNILELLPFIPVMESIANKQSINEYLTENRFNSYMEILDLINKKGIEIYKLSNMQLRQKVHNKNEKLAVFSEPLFSYLLSNEYLDPEYIIDNFDFIYEKNKDSKIIENIITNTSFKPIISNADRLLFLLEKGNKFNVESEIYNDFLVNLKNDYLEKNNLDKQFFEIEILKNNINRVLCSRDEQAVFEKVIEAFFKITTVYLNNENVKSDINNLITDRLNISFYEKMKSSFSFFNEDEMFVKKIMEKSIFKENSSFFYDQIYLNGFNILKYFKNLETEDMNQYRVCWLYYYLSEKEDNKISAICNARQKQEKKLQSQQTAECLSVENDLNLIFKESIFNTSVYFMSYEFYRNNKEYLRECENLTKDDLLLTYIFNSKLTFSEIELAIRNIKGNELFNLNNLLTNFICKESERNFEFLYEKSSSFEKVEFLRANDIKEPTNFNTVEILHNCILNNDIDFIKYSMNKMSEINENDVVNFLNDIGLYAKYNDGEKEAIFVISIIEDIFKILELKESSNLLEVKNLKINLEKLHNRTLQPYIENHKLKGNEIVNFKSVESQWTLMEKDMISKQMINKVTSTKKNRL